MGKKRIVWLYLFLAAGVIILCYPTVSSAINRRSGSYAIGQWRQDLVGLEDSALEEQRLRAQRYNQELQEKGEAEGYEECLNLGNGMMGYIRIPKIDVELPIYEGTSEAALSKGVGHLPQSSFPIGGESTHSVLSGHRGLPSAVLFTDLDKLEKGDCFYLHILDDVLAYQVDQIKVVEPNETGDLDIIQGKDYCTLVTCTPYSINTHRLLVRGFRVPYTGEESKVQYQELRTGMVIKRLTDVWPWLVVAAVLVIGSEALLMRHLILRRKKREEED